MPQGSADFALTGAAAGATTISPGQSVTFNIDVSSLGASFNNAVALSCGPLPDQTTCTFKSASVTPGAGGATTTLTISTAGVTRAGAAPTALPWSVLWLTTPLAGVLMGARRGRRSRAAILLVLLAILATMHVACGGGGGIAAPNTNSSIKAGTPSGSYTVTVQGASGPLTHSTTVSFTVQ
ncbi:MAG: hypothetical protein JOY79_01350 [Acidobacteriaceae bacterium]|nr:hypothetical protein [Acidobacteriaceae bacterium]